MVPPTWNHSVSSARSATRGAPAPGASATGELSGTGLMSPQPGSTASVLPAASSRRYAGHRVVSAFGFTGMPQRGARAVERHGLIRRHFDQRLDRLEHAAVGLA